MEGTFYWVGSLPLEPGSIVMPGNWYRLVSSIPGHNCALREMIYEQVRQEKFSHLPSRMSAIFLCSSQNDMEIFLQKNPRPLDILYEVELIDASPGICTVDSDLAALQNMQDGGRLYSINEYTQNAEAYWTSASSTSLQSPEVITESPIRIIRRL